MPLSTPRFAAAALGALALTGAGTTPSVAAVTTGPSSSEAPHILPAAPGVSTTSILTVGDGTPYKMVGIPDGMGAYDNYDGSFTLLMNHELGGTQGVERAHGAKGAFVSKWRIKKNRNDLRVRGGSDLVKRVNVWDATTEEWRAATSTESVFNRLCSADLPKYTAFFSRSSLKGYAGSLYTNGEEAGTEGRAFAHTTGGTSYELPALGKFSYENLVAHPNLRDTTMTVGLDDSGNGQVYFFKGRKQYRGTPVEKAGLAKGTLYGLKIDGVTTETDATELTTAAFTAADLGDVRKKTGAQLETDSNTLGVTQWQRPEDGHWDPTNPKVFWFVTTASFAGKSRLWKLTFVDPARPELGGQVELALDGTEGQKMLDNITVNSQGQVLLQEDPGNQSYVARVWLYTPSLDKLTEVGTFDPALFTPDLPGFITADEESSGIIEAKRLLGTGWYLLNTQVHANIAPDPFGLVQRGQLLAMYIPPALT
ncbi:MAG: alkaline phosphatase PhoX [Solirubrobacteraceae bacterium]